MNAEIAQAKAMQQRIITKSAQVLMGIYSGLTADGKLNDNEIHFLRTWLAENQDVASIWPGDLIWKQINDVLADGIITEDERSGLLKTLQQLSGNEFIETGAATPTGPCVPFDNIEISFHGKSFCLTGHFFYGTRAACEKLIIGLGAIPVGNVTGSTDYLVVGTGCSGDWVNTTYGRKIETAIERKKRYGMPAIVSEERWALAAQQAAG